MAEEAPAPGAELRPRELRAVSPGDAYRVDLRSARHSWTLDEPAGEGGTDAGPTPVEALLGGLLSCLIVSFKFQAKRRGVAIERVEGWIAANERRYLEQVEVELEVWSAAPEADVHALLPGAEKGCFVGNVLRPDLTYTIDLAVYPPAAAG